jgi:chitinase
MIKTKFKQAIVTIVGLGTLLIAKIVFAAPPVVTTPLAPHETFLGSSPQVPFMINVTIDAGKSEQLVTLKDAVTDEFICHGIARRAAPYTNSANKDIYCTTGAHPDDNGSHGALFHPRFQAGSFSVIAETCNGTCQSSAPFNFTVGERATPSFDMLDTYASDEVSVSVNLDLSGVSYESGVSIYEDGAAICGYPYVYTQPTPFVYTVPGCDELNWSEGMHTINVKVCNQGARLCTDAMIEHTFEVTAPAPFAWDLTDWEARKATGPYNGDTSRATYNTTNSDKWIGAYYTAWSVYDRNVRPKDIPVENLTHIFHAFIAICGPNGGIGSKESALEANCTANNKEKYEVVIWDRQAELGEGLAMSPALDSDPAVGAPYGGIFAEYARMKEVFPHIKIIASIAGATLSDPLFAMGHETDPAAARKVFIDSVIQFLKDYPFFDGVDVDWETPNWKWGSAAGNHTAVDKRDGESYRLLLEELNVALENYDSSKELSTAIIATTGVLTAINDNATSHGQTSITDDLQKAIAAVDQFNLMSYDYAGSWSQPGHQTALGNNSNFGYNPDNLSVKSAVNFLTTTLGVAPSKIGVGVAMYGRNWDINGNPLPQNDAEYAFGTGIQDYRGIEEFRLCGTCDHYSEKDYGPNLSDAEMIRGNTTGDYTSVDTHQSTLLKAAYVKSEGLGGIFGWSIDGDTGTLVDGMHQGLGTQPVVQCTTCRFANAVNLTATLTGPDASKVNSSQPLSGSYPAWKSFDVESGGWTMWISKVINSSTPAHISYSFDKPTVVTGYRMLPQSSFGFARAPKSWRLEALDQSGTWQVLDTHTNVSISIWDGSKGNRFEVNNSNMYEDYRIVFTQANRHTVVSLRKIELY